MKNDYASKDILKSQPQQRTREKDNLGCIVSGACTAIVFSILAAIASQITIRTSIKDWKPYTVRGKDTCDRISENLRQEYGGSEHLRHDIRDSIIKKNGIKPGNLHEGMVIQIPADAHEDDIYDIVRDQIRSMYR